LIRDLVRLRLRSWRIGNADHRGGLAQPPKHAQDLRERMALTPTEPFFLRPFAALGFIAATLLFSPGCKRESPSAGASAQRASALPVITDETQGLLFTWIDERGEFHTEERAKDVALVGRDMVRVLDPEREQSGDEVLVADLRNAGASGSYAVRTIARAAFDDVARDRRKKAGKTIEARAPQGTAQDPGQDPRKDPGSSAASRPPVIIYGASWCGACHEAAAYLKKKGIAFVEKDIEADPSAEREMSAKLAKAGLRGSGIPVMDVKGQVMVGFSAPKLEAALASTR
jgi:glutaredoxin